MLAGFTAGVGMQICWSAKTAGYIGKHVGW